MPMNIMQLQKSLEMLPDQSLAGYVQNPSGEVPQYLVLSELSRRKKLRDGAAMANAHPAQSTVRDDLVGQGLGALPAQGEGAEQAYATGGLVAFADGGNVGLRYGYRAPGQFTPEEIAAARAWDAAHPDIVRQNQALANPYSTPPVVDENFDPGMFADPMGLPSAIQGDVGPQWNPVQAVKNTLANVAKSPSALYSGPTAGAQKDVSDIISKGIASQTPAPASAAPVRPSSGSPLAAPAVGGGGGGLRGLSASVRTKTPGVGVAGGAGPDLTQYKPISDEDRIASMKKWNDYLTEQNKGEFDEEKQRLAAERAELAGRKGTNINNAMIQAGLAMMAGKSQYALQNIGEGGQQGLAYLQKANEADDQTRRFLSQEQGNLSRAQAAARRGDQQAAMGLQAQAEKDRQFAVSAAQQRENYLLAHQDRMAQIQATLQAAAMRVSAGGGTKSDGMILKAAKIAEDTADKWLAANKGSPKYMFDPEALQRDLQAVKEDAYSRVMGTIGREVPAAVSQQNSAPTNNVVDFTQLRK